MNRAVTVMSRSADENRRDDTQRQLHSPSDPRHTNYSFPYSQPHNVAAHHQSPYRYPLMAPCVSRGFVPPCSTQIQNSLVPNTVSLPSDYPYVSCQSVLPDKQWYQTPRVGSTSCYALGTQAASKPAVVQGGTPSQVLSPTLPSRPVEGHTSHGCAVASKDCGNGYSEDSSGTTLVDLNRAALSSDSTDIVTSSSSAAAASVAVVSGSDSTTNVLTSASQSDTTVGTSPAAASPVTPRPKCGRAKTNAELKRQLMERREQQRLREMLDSSSDGTVPSSCTTASVVSASACKQTEASAAVVSYYNTNLATLWYFSLLYT